MKDEDNLHFRVIGDVHGHLDSYVQVAKKAHASFQVGDMGFNYDYLLKKKYPGHSSPNEPLDSNRHVFIGGNHDNYTLGLTDLSVDDPRVIEPCSNYTVVGFGEHNMAEQHVGYLHEVNNVPAVYEFIEMPPHHLGSYGVWKVPGVEPVDGGLSGYVFFVRGAWSIDGKFRRTRGKEWHWFPREQVSMSEGTRALEMYEEVKPDFVITHAAPTFILNHLRLLFSDGNPIPTQTGRLLEAMFEVHKPKLWCFGHYHQSWRGEFDGTQFMCLNQFPDEGWTLDFDKHMKIIGFDGFEDFSNVGV